MCQNWAKLKFVFTCLNDEKCNALSMKFLHQSKIILWIQICFCFRKVIQFCLKIIFFPYRPTLFFSSMLQEIKYLFCLALDIHQGLQSWGWIFSFIPWGELFLCVVSQRFLSENILLSDPCLDISWCVPNSWVTPAWIYNGVSLKSSSRVKALHWWKWNIFIIRMKPRSPETDGYISIKMPFITS